MSGHGPGHGCPSWCQQREPGASAHARTMGQAEHVGVTLVQAGTWHAPQVYVTHWDTPGPYVLLSLRSANDTATILSRLGHEGLATLITMAIAAATDEPGPEAPEDTEDGR